MATWDRARLRGSQGPRANSPCGAVQQAKKLGPVPLFACFISLSRSPRLPPPCRRRSRRRVISRSLQPTPTTTIVTTTPYPYYHSLTPSTMRLTALIAAVSALAVPALGELAVCIYALWSLSRRSLSLNHSSR